MAVRVPRRLERFIARPLFLAVTETDDLHAPSRDFR
jgi:hypothetical protein